MGETFYTALGVEADADRETIKRAYRDHVKETHPDVSDSPDAAERFKRLTTARDVLVDEHERRQYDRLGHDSYVGEHVSDSAWAPETDTSGETETGVPGRTDSGSHPRETADGTAEAGRHPDSRTRSQSGNWNRGRSRASGRQRTRDHSRAERAERTERTERVEGGYGRANWQTASEAYTRTRMDVDVGQQSTVDRLIAVVQALGPWLFVHLALVLSSVATGWFLLARGAYFGGSVPAVVTGLLVVVAVLWLSVLHMLAELYS